MGNSTTTFLFLLRTYAVFALQEAVGKCSLSMLVGSYSTVKKFRTFTECRVFFLPLFDGSGSVGIFSVYLRKTKVL